MRANLVRKKAQRAANPPPPASDPSERVLATATDPRVRAWLVRLLGIAKDLKGDSVEGRENRTK
ncbi:MAG: hypothetical protein L0241_14685 [Planctomycetia bacterium]|nr:hypothetical protein [Planctomycetia bacterium]